MYTSYHKMWIERNPDNNLKILELEETSGILSAHYPLKHRIVPTILIAFIVYTTYISLAYTIDHFLQ